VDLCLCVSTQLLNTTHEYEYEAKKMITRSILEGKGGARKAVERVVVGRR